MMIQVHFITNLIQFNLVVVLISIFIQFRIDNLMIFIHFNLAVSAVVVTVVVHVLMAFNYTN